MPTIGQANLFYLLLVIIITIGSGILQPILGLGGNLWINEFVYLLLPVVLLCKLNGWSFSETYRYKKTPKNNIFLGILSGISIWFFAAYISIIVTTILDKSVGKVSIDLSGISNTPLQGILMLIGMVVLAPLCEELFFRGFIQRAYESYSAKYSYIIAGVLFGLFHVLNGVSSIFSATIMGVVLGYLMYRTDSIFTSMSAHAAMNFSAILFSAALTSMDITKVPVWFHVAAFVGLGLCLFLLRLIRKNNMRGRDISIGENLADERKKGNAYAALVIAILFLFAIGSFEIIMRSGSISVPASVESKKF
jgi:membrane protease YdiL (CAAX protease family)